MEIKPLKVSNISPKNNPDQRQKIINDIRLIQYNLIMEYKKIINLIDNITNEPTKFRTRNWVEINDESGGTYNDSN